MSTTCLPEVPATRCAEWIALRDQLGLDDFDPTSVNWDVPVIPFPQTGSARIMPVGAGRKSTAKEPGPASARALCQSGARATRPPDE